MIGIRVALSNGENLWLDCKLEEAIQALAGDSLIEIGGRAVNPCQVAQLVIEQVPSIESAAQLQEESCS